MTRRLRSRREQAYVVFSYVLVVAFVLLCFKAWPDLLRGSAMAIGIGVTLTAWLYESFLFIFRNGHYRIRSAAYGILLGYLLSEIFKAL